MLRYLVPHFPLRDLPAMLGVAAVGALLAGAYGIVHDQVTYSIAPEYFTKLKFIQFHYADWGFGDRVFAGTIGFLATWWVGLIAAWLLARRLMPGQPRSRAYRQILVGFAVIFASGFCCGVAGYVYGLWRGPAADYSAWDWAIERFEITDTWSFVRVAYIHNAGYLGGLLGLIAALWFIRPPPAPALTEQPVACEAGSGLG
jgi:hypothetical protein